MKRPALTGVVCLTDGFWRAGWRTLKDISWRRHRNMSVIKVHKHLLFIPEYFHSQVWSELRWELVSVFRTDRFYLIQSKPTKEMNSLCWTSQRSPVHPASQKHKPVPFHPSSHDPCSEQLQAEKQASQDSKSVTIWRCRENPVYYSPLQVGP